MRGDSALVMRVMTGERTTSTPHIVEVYKRVRAFVQRHRLKVSYQWVPRSENKDADAACTAAREAKDSVVLFEQPEVSPPCGHVCASCTASGGDTSTAGDQNAADATGIGVSSDDEDDLVDVPLTFGKRHRGRPRKPRPAEAK